MSQMLNSSSNPEFYESRLSQLSQHRDGADKFCEHREHHQACDLAHLEELYTQTLERVFPERRFALEAQISQDYSILKSRLVEYAKECVRSNENDQNTFKFGDREQAILKLKLARHYTNVRRFIVRGENSPAQAPALDLNTLYDAIIESPKALKTPKGSLSRLLEIHEQKTIQKIAEIRKKRAEIDSNEDWNPYEALFTTSSGNYYLARLFNLPHLEEESIHIKHCVGTSDCYWRQIKRGEIEILSFRSAPQPKTDPNTGRIIGFDGELPIITIEYNPKTGEILQLRKANDECLKPTDSYFNDVIEALKLLPTTTTDTNKPRKITSIHSLELQHFEVKDYHVFTDQGEQSIFQLEPQALTEGFVLKFGKIELNHQLTEQQLQTILTLIQQPLSQRPTLTIASGYRPQFNWPDKVFANLNFRSLTTAEGLQLPQIIDGELDLSSLTTAEGLQLPRIINGNLYFNNLTTAEGIQLPQIIKGDFFLSKLTTAEGLQLSYTTIGRGLYLNNLTTAEGIQLPQIIKGDFYLNSLTTTKGLSLSHINIDGNLYLDSLLDSLTTVEKIKLRKQYPHLRIVRM